VRYGRLIIGLPGCCCLWPSLLLPLLLPLLLVAGAALAGESLLFLFRIVAPPTPLFKCEPLGPGPGLLNNVFLSIIGTSSTESVVDLTVVALYKSSFLKDNSN